MDQCLLARVAAIEALMAAIAGCEPHDAMLAMSGVLWDMRAGTPLPPLFNLKEDAEAWAAAATPDELLAYARAAITALEDLAVGKRSRMDLAAAFMSGLSVEDCREAFRHSRRGAASARTAPDPASGDPQGVACRVTLGARTAQEKQTPRR